MQEDTLTIHLCYHTHGALRTAQDNISSNSISKVIKVCPFGSQKGGGTERFFFSFGRGGGTLGKMFGFCRG